MKNFTINLIILNFLFASSVSAQNNWNQNCGVSVQVRTSQFQPDTIVNGDSVIVVPTVFHILTQGGAENISKSHVYRALQILNQDFNRQNSDTFDIPSPFHPVRGNPRIEFRLARIDPQGNCTDGIDRIYTPQEGIYGNLYDNFGWNHTKYLNIYIVKWIENEPLRSGLAYLASIDSGQTQPDNSDFIEAPYYVIGDGFNGFLAPQRSHLLTHETAHNLGLNHVWGALSGCTDDDDVTDTPLQDDASTSYPVFPEISCNNGPNGDMFNNFEDYAENINMFTEGQVDRMRTCLARNEWRTSLWTPSNLTATGVDSTLVPCQNIPIADFGYGNFSGLLCTDKPVQFYEAASSNANSWNWEFVGGNPALSTDTFPSVIFADSGLHRVTLIVSNSFGLDTVEKLIRILPAPANYNASMTESFEDTILNEQITQWNALGKRWSITNLAADSGNYSIRLDSSLKFFSTFFTHTFDLNQVTSTGRTLEFRVALGLSPVGAPINGGLRVTWKRPCENERDQMIGNNYRGAATSALHPGEALVPDSLRTAVTNAVFIPTANQWKTISLTIPDSISGEVQIGFDWGSFTPTNKLKGLYIDNIKVKSGSVAIEENNSALNWKIFPNPASDELIISLENKLKESNIAILDITGKLIFSTVEKVNSQLKVNTSGFPNGIYFVQIQNDQFTGIKKVVIAK